MNQLNYVILCTVPHTGTNFFTQLFSNYGYSRIGPNATPNYFETADVPIGWFTRCHISKDMVRFCLNYKKRGATIVTTIRKLDDLRASWKARGRDKHEDLERDLELHRELIRRVKPFIITFEENYERDERLKKLTDHLGIELHPDWSIKVGERKR